MPVAQSPAHYINSSKGCPSITESFPLCFLLVLCATVAALPVVEPHSSIYLSRIPYVRSASCRAEQREEIIAHNLVLGRDSSGDATQHYN
jgi:hypothetical protein